MAVAAKNQKAKEFTYAWEGKDKTGKQVKGEMRAPGEASVSAYLRRQGVNVTKIKKQNIRGKAITAKDITLFTRQLRHFPDEKNALAVAQQAWSRPDHRRCR